MTTLGGLTISDDMYLGGLTESNGMSVQQVRSVKGVSALRTFGKPGGRTLTLASSQANNSIQGIWCSWLIDDLKTLQNTQTPVTLTHDADTYTVVITETHEFQPLHKYEQQGPNKRYLGKIKMIEV